MSNFNKENFKCSSFLVGLNNCKSMDELKKYIDDIVLDLYDKDNVPEELGVVLTGPVSVSEKKLWLNNGVYDGFIFPATKYRMGSFDYAYRLYDKEYLYDFALSIKRLRLSNDTSLLPFIMKFLDYYFGVPKGNVDQREDIMYSIASDYAEEFYKRRGVVVRKEFGACDQMLMCGDFPLTWLKGTACAQCSERAVLAQNILKVCGYDSSIMYGDAESRGMCEAHAWNAIKDDSDNIMIIDYSNTVHCFVDGKFVERKPYCVSVDSSTYLVNDGVLEARDYHYENGVKVFDNKVRKYAAGKFLENVNVISNNFQK